MALMDSGLCDSTGTYCNGRSYENVFGEKDTIKGIQARARKFLNADGKFQVINFLTYLVEVSDKDGKRLLVMSEDSLKARLDKNEYDKLFATSRTRSLNYDRPASELTKENFLKSFNPEVETGNFCSTLLWGNGEIDKENSDNPQELVNKSCKTYHSMATPESDIPYFKLRKWLKCEFTYNYRCKMKSK